MPCPPESYTEAVRELETLGIMPSTMPSLAPIRRALERAGLADGFDPARNIVVAGTNGKGTVCATLSRLLLSAGQRVGLYTSPHLVTTRERIRICEEDVSDEDFVGAYRDLRPVILEECLTHFEALTLIAARLFRLASLDWCIWEVGLGGLFDATNAIPHEWCAITRLGFDHVGLLGRTLPEIAAQKFGIVGPGAVVVHSHMEPELDALRSETAARTGCRWIPARAIESFGSVRPALSGKRAVENTATALSLFEALGFDPSRHLDCLANVRWPGRFSRFGQGSFHCPAYVSGDHNVQGVQSLLEILSRHSWDALHLVVGIGKDKDADRMLQALVELPRMKLYLTEPPFKPLPVDEYPKRFLARAVMASADVRVCLERARQDAAPEDLIVVTGSLYLVGKVLEAFGT